MKILHILPSYLPAVRYGGPTFAVHGLCRALAMRGHRIEVFTTNIDGAESSDVPLGVPVNIDGVIVKYFASNHFRRLFWAPKLKRDLRKEMCLFDLVHLHSVFLWPTWAAAQLARQNGVPYLISPRGMLVKSLIMRRSRLAKSAWLRLVEKRNLEKSSAIHVTSELESDELIRFGWRLPRVEIIPNGIDDAREWSVQNVSAEVAEISKTKPFLLFLGRLSWKKGLDRLLKAFARTGMPSLVIVGPDDEQMTPELIQLAQSLGIANRVRILPRTVLGVDKEYLYATAKAFVLPSYSENFGNTVLEAMQRGLPVIATPEVGAAKIVRDAKAGIVVSGEPDSLGYAISKLLNSDAIAREMGEAGRRHVAENYGWSRIAVQMEDLYCDLFRDRDADKSEARAVTAQSSGLCEQSFDS